MKKRISYLLVILSIIFEVLLQTEIGILPYQSLLKIPKEKIIKLEKIQTLKIQDEGCLIERDLFKAGVVSSNFAFKNAVESLLKEDCKLQKKYGRTLYVNFAKDYESEKKYLMEIIDSSSTRFAQFLLQLNEIFIEYFEDYKLFIKELMVNSLLRILRDEQDKYWDKFDYKYSEVLVQSEIRHFGKFISFYKVSNGQMRLESFHHPENFSKVKFFDLKNKKERAYHFGKMEYISDHTFVYQKNMAAFAISMKMTVPYQSKVKIKLKGIDESIKPFLRIREDDDFDCKLAHDIRWLETKDDHFSADFYSPDGGVFALHQLVETNPLYGNNQMNYFVLGKQCSLLDIMVYLTSKQNQPINKTIEVLEFKILFD